MTQTNTIKVWVILLLLVVSTSVCYAGEKDGMDGRTLQAFCADYLDASLKGKLSDDNQAPFMRCAHYMQGIADAINFYERMSFTVSGDRLLCFPKRLITMEEAILVTHEYLKRHPEKLDSQAVVLIMAAFFEAYPCSR